MRIRRLTETGGAQPGHRTSCCTLVFRPDSGDQATQAFTRTLTTLQVSQPAESSTWRPRTLLQSIECPPAPHVHPPAADQPAQPSAASPGLRAPTLRLQLLLCTAPRPPTPLPRHGEARAAARRRTSAAAQRALAPPPPCRRRPSPRVPSAPPPARPLAEQALWRAGGLRALHGAAGAARRGVGGRGRPAADGDGQEPQGRERDAAALCQRRHAGRRGECTRGDWMLWLPGSTPRRRARRCKRTPAGEAGGRRRRPTDHRPTS